jgi:hypothetical protein
LRDTTSCQMGQNSTHETIMSLRDVIVHLALGTEVGDSARGQNNASLEAIRQGWDGGGIGGRSRGWNYGHGYDSAATQQKP